MNHELNQNPIDIPRGTTLRIEEGAGLLLEVRQGELWLTEEGSLEDHVLQAGHRFRISRGGATLALALQPSVVSLSSDVPANWAQRIGQLLRKTSARLAPPRYA